MAVNQRNTTENDTGHRLAIHAINGEDPEPLHRNINGKEQTHTSKTRRVVIDLAAVVH